MVLPEPIAFEWDKGNIDKSLTKHDVTNREAEEVCTNRPIFLFEDEKHSAVEKKFMAWGTTNQGRKLAVIFTIRKDKVRIISARNMHKKERKAYEEKVKTNTKI